MIFSKSCIQGIYTLCHLARQSRGDLSSAPAIARVLGIPRAQAAKVIQGLATRQLVVAHVGRRGGYALARPLGEIGLCDVLDLFDDEKEDVRMRPRYCAGANGGMVTPSSLCSAHRGLLALRQKVRGVLSGLTLADLEGTLCSLTPCPGDARLGARGRTHLQPKQKQTHPVITSGDRT